MIDIDPAFGHWLAGFTDGEGCFYIFKAKARRTYRYQCRFLINLRKDDRQILEEIQEKLGGIGYLRDKPTQKPNPMVEFSICNKSDSSILRNVFQQYPLRAKKANDFKVWSKALDCWLTHKPGDS